MVHGLPQKPQFAGGKKTSALTGGKIQDRIEWQNTFGPDESRQIGRIESVDMLAFSRHGSST